MVKLTKPQRAALKRLYVRRISDMVANMNPVPGGVTVIPDVPRYRTFRRMVQPGPQCAMVPYAGMWVGIEPDGYTHS